MGMDHARTIPAVDQSDMLLLFSVFVSPKRSSRKHQKAKKLVFEQCSFHLLDVNIYT